MAKTCDCAGLLDMAMRDPRLRTLPAAARMLWLELMMAMRIAGASVLRFGDDVPDADALALMAAMPVSEMAANLEAILRRGLLVREADGALASPMLAAQATRSDINRANALAGVAKRRARHRPEGQMELPVMSTVGGTDVASSANASEPAATMKRSLDTAKAKLQPNKAKLAVADEDYHRTGRAVLDAMGVDPAKSFVHYGAVRQWLADGASHDLILEVIARKMASGARPTSPGYFTQAIVEAVARQPVAMGSLPEASQRWTKAAEAWAAAGCVGERPQLEFFQAGGKFASAA